MDEKVLGSTVRIDLTTHDSTGALVAPSSAFASDGSDFRIYKDGSASEKTTVNGITVTSPFDSITGKHLIEIDTNNATGDSGFWAAGSEYRVEINSAKTVASVAQSGVTVGRFRLVSADTLRSLGTNAPADWINAASIDSGALNGKGDWLTSSDIVKLLEAIKTATLGVVGSGSTTTSIVTSSLLPAAIASNQFKGLIVKFTDDTTTTELRGQGCEIISSSSGGVLTVSSLTTAPVSGDTFVIQ